MIRTADSNVLIYTMFTYFDISTIVLKPSQSSLLLTDHLLQIIWNAKWNFKGHINVCLHAAFQMKGG